MLDAEFKRQRAKTARELAAIAIDPFIKKRLIDLAARYDDEMVGRRPLTPLDLEVPASGTGSEK